MMGTVGQCLKDKRAEMGISAEQAANIIGCSLGSIYNWETGISSVSDKYLDDVMDFIGEDAIIVPDPGRDYEPIPEKEEKPAAASKPKKAAKTEEKRTNGAEPSVKNVPALDILDYEVITNNRERIQVKAETVKFAGDKGWVCFSIMERLVATFRTSEILGVREV